MTAASSSIIIIGGGLGGLAAALYLARAGHRVTVLERSSALGGRARTSAVQGFSLNLGPHALYRGGAGTRVLEDLGVPLSGRAPDLRGARALHRDRMHALPVGAWPMLTTGLLGLRDRLATARLLTRLPAIDADAFAGTSVGDWIRGLGVGPTVELLVHAMVRLSSYAHAPDGPTALDAAHAIRQLVLAQSGVIYLDGGWQSLVDGLRARAEAAGVDIRTRARVEAVVRRPDGTLEVRMAGDVRHPARVVVVATPPDVAAALLAPVSRAARAWAADSVPVRAACLDIALRHLPRPRATLALGMDEPIYFSVHSGAAALAPAGGAVIHLARYLRPGEPPDARAVRQQLEALLDRLQPGWRAHLVHARFLPAMTVASALPLAAGQGRRPGPAVPDAAGVHIVGDWVGDGGLLADATLASARQAARRVLAAAPEDDAAVA